MQRSIIAGFLGTFGLFGFYLAIVGALSDWSLARMQFLSNWPWIVGLAIGFGIQVALFFYLRALHRARMSGTVAATTGTVSALTMVACCTHYLVGILPIVGISGLATVIGSYQQELFGFGIVANMVGIGYMVRQLINIKNNIRCHA